MKLPTLKLSTRLGIAFSTMVLLTLAVGGFATWRVQRMHAATTAIAEASLPSVRLLGEIRLTANQLRRVESDFFLATSPAELQLLEKKYLDLKVTQADKVSSYLPLAEDAAEKEILPRFQENQDAYFADHSSLVELVQGGSKSHDAALKFFRGASRDHFNTMMDEVGNLVQYNNDEGKENAAIATAEFKAALAGILAMGGAALVTALVLAFWIMRGVRRQLGGEPAEAAALAQRVADGDLSAHIAVRAGDSSSLLAALKRMQESLSGIVAGVRNNADGVAIASAEIAQGNNDLSSRTEEQASALQQTAASMKQLASTVRQNAENAQQGNRLAQEASTVAARGGEVVGQVVQTMKGINDSSRRIADIISVIDGIAFQTNILALNAAVEAARAGEQGRGFAVVASEVRTLAQRSADAAKEIKDLITASVDRVEQGSALVDQAGHTMSEVVHAIRRVTDLMGEISAASDEQSTGVAQIGEAVNQMDRATQQNAALVEESAAAADSLRSQAHQLVGAVSIFRTSGEPPAAANMPVAQAVQAVQPAQAAPAPIRVSPAPTARTTAHAPVDAPAQSATVRTGTDDWQSF